MVLDGASSEAVPVVSSEPQGIVLAPIICFSFINIQCVKTKVWLFQDGCVVYGLINNISDVQMLQEDLNYMAAMQGKKEGGLISTWRGVVFYEYTEKEPQLTMLIA